MVFGPRGFKSHPRRFLINPLGSFPLGEIVSFGLWMQKQGYRTSTTHYCIQAIKSVARRANLLDPESAKTYVATANVTEARKAKLMIPVSYAKLHNAKGSIKRRIKHLGLNGQLTVETRQRKLLIMKK